jgi:hypothetical protein
MDNDAHAPWWADNTAEDRLRNTIAALQEAAEIISIGHDDTVSVGEIEGALVEVLRLDAHSDILDRDLDAEAITSLLSTYDFTRLRPKRICEIQLAVSFVPGGVTILLTEAKVKLRGEIWTVYKSDADPFPSNPHAHNYRLGVKMHLGNGDLYGYKEKVPSAKLRRSLLLEFRARVQQANPAIVLPPLAV